MPAVFTAVAVATVTPPKVQLLVSAVVVYWVVRLAVFPKQIANNLSAPRFGFGLTVTVTFLIKLSHPFT